MKTKRELMIEAIAEFVKEQNIANHKEMVQEGDTTALADYGTTVETVEAYIARFDVYDEVVDILNVIQK